MGLQHTKAYVAMKDNALKYMMFGYK